MARHIIINKQCSVCLTGPRLQMEHALGTVGPPPHNNTPETKLSEVTSPGEPGQWIQGANHCGALRLFGVKMKRCLAGFICCSFTLALDFPACSLPIFWCIMCCFCACFVILVDYLWWLQAKGFMHNLQEHTLKEIASRKIHLEQEHFKKHFM